MNAHSTGTSDASIPDALLSVEETLERLGGRATYAELCEEIGDALYEDLLAPQERARLWDEAGGFPFFPYEPAQDDHDDERRIVLGQAGALISAAAVNEDCRVWTLDDGETFILGDFADHGDRAEVERVWREEIGMPRPHAWWPRAEKPEEFRWRTHPTTRIEPDDGRLGESREAALAASERTSWSEVDLGPILDGDLDEAPPEFVCRTDGPALLYRGKVSGIHGEPESCKGWFACHAAADVLGRGEHVVYVDFEDSARGVVARMLALGIEADTLRARFHYLQPEEELNERTGPHLTALLDRTRPALVILDGITQALSNQGYRSTDNDEIGKFFRILPRNIARTYNAAVLLIDHVTKSAEDRGRYAIGAQQKLAAIDGAQFGAEVIRPFGRGKDGQVRLKVTKDRPGHVRAHTAGAGHAQRVAEMMLVSLPHGRVLVRLETPAGTLTDSDGIIRPTEVMERISRYLEPGTEPARRENVVAGVTGKRERKIQALDLLASNGYVEEFKDGAARAYRSLRPFRRDDRSPNVPGV